MSRLLGVLIITAGLLGGCTTRPIVDHPIETPASLEPAEMEAAIRAAVSAARRLPGMPDLEHQTDPGYTRGDWSLEDGAPGFFKAVLRTTGYGSHQGPVARVLKVGIWYSGAGVRTRIVGANGLKFDGGRVHKTALKWQQSLDERIRRELVWAAERKKNAGG